MFRIAILNHLVLLSVNELRLGVLLIRGLCSFRGIWHRVGDFPK